MESWEGVGRGAWDVVICGGGLAGLTLARQIRRELPELSLLLLDIQAGPSRVAAHKVGEATTELSANYLANMLGLKEYLETSHLRKMGLRFFFSNGNGPFQDRPELGTSEFDPIDSFQLDRGILENDLREFNRDLGVTTLTNTRVDDINLAEGDGLHEVTFTDRGAGRAGAVRCRWVIDAMGRRRYLQKKLGLAQPSSRDCSSAWFRLEGRIDVCDLVPRAEQGWHGRVPGGNRYFSTNHLLGDGRWVWVIPLASGCTSIGIVTRESVIPFSEYNTYERALAWLEKNEKALRDLIGSRRPLDFKCMRHYSYSSKRVFSRERWACTGEAGVFADPLFSFGIDQIGFGNTIITDMIGRERAGRLGDELVEHYNRSFLGFNLAATWLTQTDMPIFGNAVVVGAKLLWDIVRGWGLTAPQRYNQIYLDLETSAAVAQVTAGMPHLITRMEKLFKEWAARSRGRGRYRFVDYFDVPGVRELYLRSVRGGKGVGEIVGDYRLTVTFLEELARAIYMLALEDTAPEAAGPPPAALALSATDFALDRTLSAAGETPPSQPAPERFTALAGRLRSLFGFDTASPERRGEKLHELTVS